MPLCSSVRRRELADLILARCSWGSPASGSGRARSHDLDAISRELVPYLQRLVAASGAAMRSQHLEVPLGTQPTRQPLRDGLRSPAHDHEGSTPSDSRQTDPPCSAFSRGQQHHRMERPGAGDHIDFCLLRSPGPTAERAKFDFFFLAEGLRLHEQRGRVHDLDVVGRPDTFTVLGALAAVTEHSA